jgi:hypothetical protein
VPEANKMEKLVFFVRLNLLYEHGIGLENQFSTKKSGKANQEFCKTPLLYAFIR